jgi:hypothetical protein
VGPADGVVVGGADTVGAGVAVGARDDNGAADGAAVGVTVGEVVGASVVGANVGGTVGAVVGANVGGVDGTGLGFCANANGDAISAAWTNGTHVARGG